jgi:hypothetical protein
MLGETIAAVLDELAQTSALLIGRRGADCGLSAPIHMHGPRPPGVARSDAWDVSYDGLFLYTIEDPERGELLGGIEWVAGGGPDPDRLPGPDMLDIRIP